MAYKRGTDDIDTNKVDAAIDIASTSTIEANGEMGTLSFTLNGAWAHDGTFGAGGTLIFNNDKILVDSCITLALQNDVLCRLYVITQQAGRAYFVCVNYSGSAVADDTVIKINYRISN
tara:strand:- start:510 stop:863 length:354 start_codon:yes stop_codon:yes gene_type:complete